MSLKESLLKNSVAVVASKVTVILVRFLQVPLFINSLGVAEYGKWLVLSSLPSWLVLSNLGFGSVAANEMSICVASSDTNEARSIFSTALALVFAILVVCMSFISVLIYIFPIQSIWTSNFNSANQIKWAFFWLSLSVFVSFSAEIYGGRFRAANKAHLSTFISSIRSWIEIGGIFIALLFTKRFDVIAFISFSSTIVYLFLKSFFSKRVIPYLVFDFSQINKRHLKQLFGKGLAFQAFPMGNAMLFQGNILVIQYVLGASSVVLFSTVRTLVRSINQLFEMINHTIWPQLSLLFGQNDFENLRKIHRSAVFIAFFVSLLCVFPLYFIGMPIYKFWTGKAIPLNNDLLFLFLLPICFNALWYTSSVVHLAFNKHEGLAARYLIGCTISLIACFLLSIFYGINGAAISTIFADLFLIPYVFNKSLRFTNDTFSDFSASIFTSFLSFKNRISSIFK